MYRRYVCAGAYTVNIVIQNTSLYTLSPPTPLRDLSISSHTRLSSEMLFIVTTGTCRGAGQSAQTLI